MIVELFLVGLQGLQGRIAVTKRDNPELESDPCSIVSSVHRNYVPPQDSPPYLCSATGVVYVPLCL